jgi:hypothetical protein
MADRRKTSRVAIPDGADGVLHVSQDVRVERVSDSELVVLSAVRVPKGEELKVWLHYSDGTSQAVVARAMERTPALMDGLIQHRIRLQVVARKAQKDL